MDEISEFFITETKLEMRICIEQLQIKIELIYIFNELSGISMPFIQFNVINSFIREFV